MSESIHESVTEVLPVTTLSVPSDLAAALGKATQPVHLVDEQGKLLGSFSPAAIPARDIDPTPEEIAEMKRRAALPGPRLTTEEVLAHLRSLESA